jgi:RHS repeat-associated protein
MSGRTMISNGRGTAVALALLVSLIAPLGWAVNTARVEYYHHDALGNVRVVTDETGQVIERHDYLPFGEECTTGACAANPSVGTGQRLRFTGKERDAESGLDSFGARYYAQRVGRFTTIDPVLDQQAALLDPQRWNRYGYVSNNPLRFVDPDGREQVAIVNGRTYMGGVDGMSAGDEHARNVVFGALTGAVGLFTPGPEDLVIAGVAAKAGGIAGRLVGKADDAVEIGRFLKGDDVAEVAANARKGASEGCCLTGVVDRPGAAGRRAERLKGVEARRGYDRDEFPPAVVKPDNAGGYRVDYVNPAQNRRSGQRLGQELKGVADGARVRINSKKE